MAWHISEYKNDNRVITVTMEGTPQTAYHLATIVENDTTRSVVLSGDIFHRLDRETANDVGEPPYGPHYGRIINGWIENGEVLGE